MSIEEFEAAALQLDPKARARLAAKLLNSLEALSEEELTQVWAEEARRRDADLDDHPDTDMAAEDVFREVRSSLG